MMANVKNTMKNLWAFLCTLKAKEGNTFIGTNQNSVFNSSGSSGFFIRQYVQTTREGEKNT